MLRSNDHSLSSDAASGTSLAPAGLSVMPDLLRRAARDYPRSAAIDFLGRRWSYRELSDAVGRVAAGLQALGVAPGDRVGLCLPNTPYFVIAYFAVLEIGAVVVNYNPLYVEREIEGQIKDSGTSVMFVIDIPSIHAKVAAVAQQAGLKHIVLCSLADALTPLKQFLFKTLKRRDRVGTCPVDGRHVAFASLAATSTPPRPIVISDEDLAVLQYTGGTTGTPKGAMLTHRNIFANCMQVLAHDPRPEYGVERVLGVLPLFHVFAMTSVMNYAVATASLMVLLPRYDLKATIKALVQSRASIFPAVPTIYAAIADYARTEKYDLSFVRLCISGGAPLPSETAAQFQAVTGGRLVEGYGLTEASPVVCCNSIEGQNKAGSVGRAMRDTIIEIRDPATGALRPAGEKGEIVVRGPQVMRGYWQRPDESALVLHDGALHTGDIGYLDEDGHLFVVDRIKDLIICGGYNVYPRVIEEALYQHSDVAEAIVIGVPDSYRGEAPKAFVVLHQGAEANAHDLKTFLEGYLSKIERPKDIEIRTSLPKTAVGKLSRKELVMEETARQGEARNAC